MRVEMASPLRTDLYELNMAASYLTRGMNAPATFSLFVRDLPPSRGYLIAAGVEHCLEWLESLHFEDTDLSELDALGFSPAQIKALRALRFTGEVWAVPEGRVVFADEPILEVTAPIAEAQLVESYLLNQITYETNAATKAARCRVAAGPIDLIEFGMRRAQGVDAALLAARACAIAGFTATSNVEAAQLLDMPAAGTMAHSYIEAFPDELQAFRAFAEDLPGRPTFLVDTYDTQRGIGAAIEVIRERNLGDRAAIRIDSGDLVGEAKAAREQLDAAGLPDVRVMVSGAIDEYGVAELVAAGAPIDAIGIGTRLVTVADSPFLDTVYKLVEYAGRPVAKLSSGKVTLPGAKQVFRAEAFRDVLSLRDERAPAGTLRLLEPVMRDGRRLNPRSEAAALVDAARRCSADLALLPESARRLEGPSAAWVRRSPALEQAANTLYTALRGEKED
jgi:nicotinate phosphoribosyltransferase